MSASDRSHGPRHHRHHWLGSSRTQEQRRSETQTRLLDATAEALADLGWAGLSTTDVSRRAGVSRGAQQHHYPSKMSLVAAALEHLLDRLRGEYRASFAALPVEQRDVAGAIEQFWVVMRQPPAMALLELALAGRTDPDLRKLSIDLSERVVEIVKQDFRELFPESLPEELMDTTIRGLFALLVGLSLQNSLDHDVHGNQAAVLTQVKHFAGLLIPAHRTAARTLTRTADDASDGASNGASDNASNGAWDEPAHHPADMHADKGAVP